MSIQSSKLCRCVSLCVDTLPTEIPSFTVITGYPHEAPHDSAHYHTEEPRVPVSPPLPSRDQQILDTEGNLAFPPLNESYSPPSLLEDQNVMQSNVTHMSHVIDSHGCRDVGMVESHQVMSGEQSLGRVSSGDHMSCRLASGDHSLDHVVSGDMSGDKGLQHVMSGDQEETHVTGEVMGVASSSAIVFQGEQSQIQNEIQGKYWNQERDADMDQYQRGSSTTHDADNVKVPSNGSNDEERCNQGGSSYNQQGHQSQVEETKSLALKDTNVPEEVEEETRKPAQAVAEVAISLATPISQQGEILVNPKQPTAVNALKRHTCETYSSDDDDVFLPNPPSKSQADKCIVAMATDEEEVAPPTIVTTAAYDDDTAPGSSEVVAMETPTKKDDGEGEDMSMEEVEVEKKAEG